jgi:DNA polymerase II small subunit/DNA polymerase delta subunit B
MERFVYEIHEGDELISRGDVDTLAYKTGIASTTIRSHASTKRLYKGWKITKVNTFVDYDKVDYLKIRMKMREFDTSKSDIAQVLDITPQSVNSKLRKASKFRDLEIELLEDLFFLNEGELIKE